MLRLIKVQLLKKINKNQVYIVGLIKSMVKDMLALHWISQIDYYFIIHQQKLILFYNKVRVLFVQQLSRYGLKDFSLEILEYCEPDKLLIREKYYIDLGAEYNIIKDPTLPPMSGRTHSEESKTIISEAKKGENHPNFNKARYDGSGRPSQQIEVTDVKTNNKTSYNSMSEAAKALNLTSYKAISDYFRQNRKKPYKGQYIFKKI